VLVTRCRLPNRRSAELYDLTFKGGRHSIGVSRFLGGALAEVFIHSAKTSSNLADIARAAAVTLSLALQYGTPADARLTPGEALEVSKLIEGFGKTLEVAELEERLNELEERMSE
jgi:hypothetical protein